MLLMDSDMVYFCTQDWRLALSTVRNKEAFEEKPLHHISGYSYAFFCIQHIRIR